jgi:hypothetical protein
MTTVAVEWVCNCAKSCRSIALVAGAQSYTVAVLAYTEFVISYSKEWKTAEPVSIIIMSRTTSHRHHSDHNDSHISEQVVQDSFHSYLKSSLTQAKAERLLDVDVLSSAEGDLMITGEIHLYPTIPT